MRAHRKCPVLSALLLFTPAAVVRSISNFGFYERSSGLKSVNAFERCTLINQEILYVELWVVSVEHVMVFVVLYSIFQCNDL